MAQVKTGMKHQTIDGIVIAFDFGLKRIGVAVGQTITKTARPLMTLQAKEGVPDWEQVSQLVKRFEPRVWVVGMPLTMDGKEQSVTSVARQFAQTLRALYQIPVDEVDERLTTKEARARIFNAGGYRALQDGQVDAHAAQLILQHWFSEG